MEVACLACLGPQWAWAWAVAAATAGTGRLARVPDPTAAAAAATGLADRRRAAGVDAAGVGEAALSAMAAGVGVPTTLQDRRPPGTVVAATATGLALALQQAASPTEARSTLAAGTAPVRSRPRRQHHPRRPLMHPRLRLRQEPRGRRRAAVVTMRAMSKCSAHCLRRAFIVRHAA